MTIRLCRICRTGKDLEGQVRHQHEAREHPEQLQPEERVGYRLPNPALQGKNLRMEKERR